jgi:hypothetical protein
MLLSAVREASSGDCARRPCALSPLLLPSDVRVQDSANTSSEVIIPLVLGLLIKMQRSADSQADVALAAAPASPPRWCANPRLCRLPVAFPGPLTPQPRRLALILGLRAQRRLRSVRRPTASLSGRDVGGLSCMKSGIPIAILTATRKTTQGIYEQERQPAKQA